MPQWGESSWYAMHAQKRCRRLSVSASASSQSSAPYLRGVSPTMSSAQERGSLLTTSKHGFSRLRVASTCAAWSGAHEHNLSQASSHDQYY